MGEPIDWAVPQRGFPRGDGRRLRHARAAGRAVRTGSAESQRLAVRPPRCSRGWGGCWACCSKLPRAYLQGGALLDEARIQQQIEARSAAKRARDFAAADRIRDELAAQGVLLKDSAAGTTWVKA